MKKALVGVVLVGVVFGLFACKGKDTVVAKVGKSKITESMLMDRLQNTPPAYQNYVNTPLGRKQFVDAIVRETIMIEAAKQVGIEKEKDYKETLKEFKDQQESQFEEFKAGLLVETYLRKIQDEIIVSDTDVQAYYNANKAQYEAPVAYTVRHILTTTEGEAEKAYEEVQRGESFAKVAQQYSQDRESVQNGGLIGPFRRGDLVPEFEKVALSLKNGQLSDIIETPYGYHIILKVSQMVMAPMKFEEAAPEIKRILERDRFDRWFEKKKQELGVSVNYDLPANSEVFVSNENVEVIE